MVSNHCLSVDELVHRFCFVLFCSVRLCFRPLSFLFFSFTLSGVKGFMSWKKMFIIIENVFCYSLMRGQWRVFWGHMTVIYVNRLKAEQWWEYTYLLLSHILKSAKMENNITLFNSFGKCSYFLHKCVACINMERAY